MADLLLDLFPRSRFVFLLRDGRDVVDSWLAAYRPGSWAPRRGRLPGHRAGPRGAGALAVGRVGVPHRGRAAGLRGPPARPPGAGPLRGPDRRPGPGARPGLRRRCRSTCPPTRLAEVAGPSTPTTPCRAADKGERQGDPLGRSPEAGATTSPRPSTTVMHEVMGPMLAGVRLPRPRAGRPTRSTTERGVGRRVTGTCLLDVSGNPTRRRPTRRRVGVSGGGRGGHAGQVGLLARADEHELAHHPVVLVAQDVAVVHVRRRRGRARRRTGR